MVPDSWFFDTKRSSLSKFYYLEPVFYFSKTDNIWAMNAFVQEKPSRTKTVSESKSPEEHKNFKFSVGSFLPSVAFSCSDLVWTLESNVVKDFRVLFRSNWHHKPMFAWDNVGIHFLVMYVFPMNFNFVGDPEAPLLLYLPFISKVKRGNFVTSGQYMNFQTFSTLQCRLLQKNFIFYLWL